MRFRARVSQSTAKCVVFTGGGTGGHIFPGIAVFQALAQQAAVRVVWIGAARGADRSIVESAGLEFCGITAGKWRRYASVRNFFDVFRVLVGTVQSYCILRALRPQALFSKGGFVSVPPCIAAWLLRIPVVTHESDISPGLATRINARFADRILVSYPHTSCYFPRARRAAVHCTGNPVRQDFFSAQAERAYQFLRIDQKKPLLTVLGGSSGARDLNARVLSCSTFLTERFYLVHQFGAGNEDQMHTITNSLSVNARHAYMSFPFIQAHLPDILAASALVLSRAGANAVWECAVLGKPMILFPLERGSSRGDQIENAEYFSAHGEIGRAHV